jgi:predicted enzyme related to lactoylglutathione lyase
LPTDRVSTLARRCGGAAMEKMPIPTVGTVIYFDDPEGNRVGAMKYDTPPHT